MAHELQRLSRNDGTYKIVAWMNKPGNEPSEARDFVVDITLDGVVMTYTVGGVTERTFSMSYEEMIEKLLK